MASKMRKFTSSQDQYKSMVSMLKMMDYCIEVKQWRTRTVNPVVDNKPEPGSALKSNEKTRVRTVVKKVAVRSRQKAAVRFRMMGKVLIHKNNRYVKGKTVNISKSGVFVATDRAIFQNDEIVRVAIKPVGMSKYYKSVARVVRFDNRNGAKGYGLQFIYPKVQKVTY